MPLTSHVNPKRVGPFDFGEHGGKRPPTGVVLETSQDGKAFRRARGSTRLRVSRRDMSTGTCLKLHTV